MTYPVHCMTSIAFRYTFVPMVCCSLLVRTVILLIFYLCRDKSCALSGSFVYICVWGRGQRKIIFVLCFKRNRIACSLGSQYLFNHLCTFSLTGILETRLSWPFAEDHLINHQVVGLLVLWVVTLWTYRQIQTFQRNVMSPSSGHYNLEVSINIFTTVRSSYHSVD